MQLSAVLAFRVDGRSVALARMLLALALAVCVLEGTAVLRGIADGKLRYPVLPFLAAPNMVAVQVFLIVGLVCALSLLLGLFAGAAAATGSGLLAFALLWDQQTYSNHFVLVTLLLAYLAFARSGRRWSIAARMRATQPAVPWWPQLLMMTQVSVLYLFAGLSKINVHFLSGVPLSEWMRWELSMWQFQALAFATVATEVFIAAALWVPRLRILAVLAGIGLHGSILVGLIDQTLVLVAFTAATMSSYGLFLRRPPMRAVLAFESVRAAPSDANMLGTTR